MLHPTYLTHQLVARPHREAQAQQESGVMSTIENNKRIVIIAGPNGAGKTTFAREFLPYDANCPNFVNADLIAAGLSPFAPELAAFKAGRIMLESIANHVRRGESFAFETTLSGLTYAQMIPAWQASGYAVKLIFLSLPNADNSRATGRGTRRTRRSQHPRNHHTSSLCIGHQKLRPL